MNILVFGATTFVGRIVVEKLLKFKLYPDCATRHREKFRAMIGCNVNAVNYDISTGHNFPLEKDYDLCIFMADSALIQSFPKNFKCKKFIFVSSASAYVKKHSRHPSDIALVKELRAAEKFVSYTFPKFVILRPTWIFCGREDKILRQVRHITTKMKILPLTLNSSGMRNPISAKDLAAIIFYLATNIWKNYDKKTLNVGGSTKYPFEQILFRELQNERIYYLTIRLPYWFYKVSIMIGKKFGILKNLSDEVFLHQSQDLSIKTSPELKSAITIGPYYGG